MHAAEGGEEYGLPGSCVQLGTLAILWLGCPMQVKSQPGHLHPVSDHKNLSPEMLGEGALAHWKVEVGLALRGVGALLLACLPAAASGLHTQASCHTCAVCCCCLGARKLQGLCPLVWWDCTVSSMLGGCQVSCQSLVFCQGVIVTCVEGGGCPAGSDTILKGLRCRDLAGVNSRWWLLRLAVQALGAVGGASACNAGPQAVPEHRGS